MKMDKACINQLEKIHTKWVTLKKITFNGTSGASLTQIEKFQAEMNKLCNFLT